MAAAGATRAHRSRNPTPAETSGDDASEPPPSAPDAGAPPPPKENQDERMLDQLENAPTVQEEDAKRRARDHRRVRGMADK